MAESGVRTPSGWLVPLVGAAAGGSAGTLLGWVFAAARMLGDAEVYPPAALPPAPAVEEWMAAGGVAGTGVGLGAAVTGWLSWRLLHRVRWSRRTRRCT